MVCTEQGKEGREMEDKGNRANSGGTSTKEVLEVEEGVWEGRVRENASKEVLGPCNRTQKRVYTKERKGVFTVKGQEGGSTGICGGSVEEGLHSAI